MKFFQGLLSPVLRKQLLMTENAFSLAFKRNSMFERDRRGDEYPIPMDKSINEMVTEGGKIFLKQCKLLVQEIKDQFQQDRKLYDDGDTDVFFRFDSEDCLKQWRISSDKTHKEGSSECKLIVNDKGKAVFYGTVDTTPPKDGKVHYAGYCAIKSVRKMKSFFRDDWFEWDDFTHLELRVKGDGRNYAINLGMGMYYDVQWFDVFTYPMHTHGGPYWQTVRIPFSKFFLTSKGRTQDKQSRVPLNKINSVGITCAAVSGPFRLEIDYIGCHVDERETEEFAYELYKLPEKLVSG